MDLGDHIYVACPGYDHHGIYCGVYRGEDTVIDYSAETVKESDARVCPRLLSEFAQGGIVRVIKYARSYPPREVVDRAMSRLGEARYDLVLNNCQHFATWCKTGEPTSSQVVRYVTLHGLAAGLLTFLTSAAAVVAWAGEPGLRGNQHTTGLAYWGNGNVAVGVFVLLGFSLFGAVLVGAFTGWLWQRNKRMWYAVNFLVGTLLLGSTAIASYVTGAHWNDDAMAALEKKLSETDQRLQKLEQNQAGQATTSAHDFITTSATEWDDMPGMSLSVKTTAGQGIFVLFKAGGVQVLSHADDQQARGWFRLVVDGDQKAITVLEFLNSAPVPRGGWVAGFELRDVILTSLQKVPAGAHAIKVQWRVEKASHRLWGSGQNATRSIVVIPGPSDLSSVPSAVKQTTGASSAPELQQASPPPGVPKGKAPLKQPSASPAPPDYSVFERSKE